jgi:hypothetical protein
MVGSMIESPEMNDRDTGSLIAYAIPHGGGGGGMCRGLGALVEPILTGRFKTAFGM